VGLGYWFGPVSGRGEDWEVITSASGGKKALREEKTSKRISDRYYLGRCVNGEEAGARPWRGSGRSGPHPGLFAGAQESLENSGGVVLVGNKVSGPKRIPAPRQRKKSPDALTLLGEKILPGRGRRTQNSGLAVHNSRPVIALLGARKGADETKRGEWAGKDPSLLGWGDHQLT